MLYKNHAKEVTKDNCWTPIESLNMTILSNTRNKQKTSKTYHK